MSAWFVFKAKAVRVFGIALALAGLVSALYFTALIWQDRIPFLPVLSVEAWLPAHPAVAWLLERVHIGVPFAALGAAMVALGALIAARQTARLRAQRRKREDGLRRVQQYRSDEARQQAYDNRLEPFIGPGTTDREPDRRVA